MADAKHIALLKAGSKAWNDNRPTKPNLQRTSLTGLRLDAFDLSAANLQGADLSKSRLVTANLDGACLDGAVLSDVKARGCSIDNASFVRADLTASDFTEVRGQADFTDMAAVATVFQRGVLSRSDFTRASFEYCGFRHADLTAARFCESLHHGTSFFDAKLDRADFRRCSVLNVDFSFSTIGNAKHLAQVHASGPSVVDVQTLMRYRIDEEFLRRIGVPESFLKYRATLPDSGEAKKYYSCFISYSSKDDAFSRKLYADLQLKGVRCFFAPRDVEMAARIRERIYEEIGVHDKLLVVVSKHSVKSNWVSAEVEAALEKERTSKKTVLFPIRLDDAVFSLSNSSAWVAEIRRTRNIGDFTGVRNRKRYKIALDQLVEDLAEN